MISFLRSVYGKVDDKGRIVFPAVFKAAMAASGQDMRLVVKKDIYADCLEMYTFAEWEKLSESIRSKLDIVFNREHAEFWRKYMSDCAVVVPDNKIGRIMIPRELLDKIGVDKEVVFAGLGYKIEIWARERREAALLEDGQYQGIAERLSDKR